MFDMVSHDVLLLATAQVLLELTLTLPLLATDVKLIDVGDVVSVAGAAAWVTVMVRVVAPGAVTVTVPVRDAAPVLAVALIENEPLPVRFAGFIFENVSHVTLLEMVQVLLELTLTLPLLATDVKLIDVGDIVSVAGAAAWVTEIVRVVAPGAVTVIVPVRDAAPVLAVALILNEPLPVRFAGVMFDMVSHDVLLLVTVHCLLEVTWTTEFCAADVGFQEAVDRLSVAGAAA